MNEWEQQQPVEEMDTSPGDPNISLKHVGILAGIIVIPLIIIGVVLPFIPKTKTPQIRIADSGLTLPQTQTETSINTVAVAVLASVTGDVQVKKGEIWSKAVAEDEIAQSDIIKTSFDSQATLLFGSGSMIRVDQNSQIALSEYSREDDSWIIKINQIFGRSWNRVQKLIGNSVYEVNTPTAVATVRGTAFGVDADASGSAITVDEGEVVAKIVDEKTPDRKVIQEVKIQKQETVDISRSKVAEIKKAVEERRPTAQIVVSRKVEKLPEWVEEHKREVEKEAPKIQEIKRRIERPRSRPTPAPATTGTNEEIKPIVLPTPSSTPFRPSTTIINTVLPSPTPATKIETEKPSPTPFTTSGTINTDSDSIR